MKKLSASSRRLCTAKLMRQMLVDHARKKLALKRNAQDMPDTASGFAAPASDEEVIAVDEALRKLALVDSRKAQVVELKYFGGLTTARRRTRCQRRSRAWSATGHSRGRGCIVNCRARGPERIGTNGANQVAGGRRNIPRCTGFAGSGPGTVCKVRMRR